MMRRSFETIQNTGTFAAIALVTVSWASTTDLTIGLLVQIRLALIAVLILSLLTLLFRQPRKLRRVVIGIFTISALGFYSVLSLWIHAPSAPMTLSSHLVLICVTSAIYIQFSLAIPTRKIITDYTAWMYIVFCLVILVLTIFMGGLRFDGSLRFVYSITTIDGIEIRYSQGNSKFYGLAAVLIAGLISQSRRISVHSLGLSCLLVTFLGLSLIGGGRGDFVFTLLLTLIRLGFIKLFALFSLITLVLFAFEDSLNSHLANYTNLIDRYKMLTVSYGMRDTLLEDSFSLLVQEPISLISGCGIGYFQSYHGYPVGLHPHNIPVEFVISFGLLISIPVAVLVLVGLWKVHEREGFSSHFIFNFLFFFLISLKSGTVLTSYTLTGSVAFLAFLGLFSFIQTTKKGNYSGP